MNTAFKIFQDHFCNLNGINRNSNADIHLILFLLNLKVLN